MKSLAFFSIAFVALAGCAEFRTHSSFVAHVDNANILLHEAAMIADGSGCYDSARSDQDRRICLDKAGDELLDRQFYGFFKRSIDVVNDLKDKGKVALTDDGTSWHFTKTGSESN